MIFHPGCGKFSSRMSELKASGWFGIAAPFLPGSSHVAVAIETKAGQAQ
jgi:hypothetical protein